MNPESRIELGRIASAHGLCGELNYVPFNLASDLPFPGMEVTIVLPGGRERPGKIDSVRVKGKNRLIGIEGVDDRTAADLLKGAIVTCRRDELPELDADEFYYGDVIGLPVRYPDGTSVGTVSAVYSLATDVIEIKLENGVPSGAEQMVPVADGFVRSISRSEVIIEPGALEME